jgi:hypothetical protein
MTKKMRIAIMTFVILFAGIGFTQAKGDTEKVLYNNTFAVNDNALLSVSHEMGNVSCKNWDKNEISVQITASIETNDPEKAAKAFEQVEFNVSGTRDAVTVVCKLKSKKNGDKYSNLNVDLVIFMPESVRLDFDHKFGNAYLEKSTGQSNVSSSYGNIQLISLSHPESKFELSFGDGEMDYFAGNSIDINYSSFELGKAGSVMLKSAYSDIEAGEIEIVNLDLEGGNLEIGKSEILKGTSKFSSLSVKELSEILEITSSYGSVEIDYMPATFSEVIIDNSYGSTTVGIDKAATYKLDGVATHCEIEYPDDMANFSEKIKTNFKTTLVGTIGKGKEAQSRVTIKSSYGGTSLKAK